MKRIAFQFHATDDPELQAQYKEHHKNVWPEMKAALKRAGWHNYSLFMRKDGLLFGYFETELSLQECLANMEKEEINAKWQKEMQKFFPAESSKRPDQQMIELEEVMHLE
eukprot:m.77096 g.77096  ORF g.77096 m.77096 type:complete len:110 (-) comp20653_c0_seq1:161-490(-)